MLNGSCHCGKCSWSYSGTPDHATGCSCTVCRRYGSLWIYGVEGEGVALIGPTRVYMRGERQIEFHFCPDCGSVIAWRGAAPGKDGRRRMAVNTRMAEPETVAGIPVVHWDGLVWDDGPEDGRTVHDMWF